MGSAPGSAQGGGHLRRAPTEVMPGTVGRGRCAVRMIRREKSFGLTPEEILKGILINSMEKDKSSPMGI